MKNQYSLELYDTSENNQLLVKTAKSSLTGREVLDIRISRYGHYMISWTRMDGYIIEQFPSIEDAFLPRRKDDPNFKSKNFYIGGTISNLNTRRESTIYISQENDQIFFSNKDAIYECKLTLQQLVDCGDTQLRFRNAD